MVINSALKLADLKARYNPLTPMNIELKIKIDTVGWDVDWNKKDEKSKAISEVMADLHRLMAYNLGISYDKIQVEEIKSIDSTG